MALLSSSGKCGGSGGGSPPPVRVLGGGGGGGNADPLLSPTLYCPVLPPWHLALLTHHALHARGEFYCFFFLVYLLQRLLL